MDKAPLLLIGAGGHAVSCIDVIEAEGRFFIVGLLGLADEIGLSKCGYEVIGEDKSLPLLAGKYPNILIAVGQIETADIRKGLFHIAREAGFALPTIVSPHSRVSRHADIGEGTIVLHGAVINANARIGANCIINSQSLVEHGSIVGDHCHISTGALINGNVRIGSQSFVGSGSVIMHGVSIGDGCKVGIGACVRSDVTAGVTFVGNRCNGE